VRIRLALSALALCLRASAAPAPDRVLFLEDGAESGRWRARWEETLGPGWLVVPFSLDGGKALDGLLRSFAPTTVVSRRPPPPAVAAALKARGLAAVAPESADAPHPGPASADPRVYLARANAQLGFVDDRGARANTARALALAPRDPEALAVLARIAGEVKDPWLAIRVAGPRDEAAARYAVGDYAGAEEAYGRALRLDPADTESSHGLALAARDRPREALAHAEAAGAHRLAAEIRCDLGDAAGCEAGLAKALRLTGDDLDALWSMVRLQRGRPGAAAYAQRAFEAAGRAPSWCRGSAYRLSARIWLELKEEERAAESLRRAIALNPDDFEALDALGGLRVRVSALRPAPAAREESPLETIESARRFADGIGRAPAWQRADAWRRVTRAWIALGFPWRAAQAVREAENLDQRSIETASLISGLRAHLPGLDVDGPRSQQIAEIDRDIAKMREETARRRKALLSMFPN